jgi:choline dehydrogenase
MWDHIFFGPSYRVTVDSFSGMIQSSARLAAQVAAYLFSHEGMLTNPSTDYLAFEKLPDVSRHSLTNQEEEILSWFPQDWPEIEVSYVDPFCFSLKLTTA